MRTPSAGLFPKTVPAGGETIAGRLVPGGTAVAANAAALMRCADTFGADVDVFRPERFVDAPDADARARMERHVELVFGVGRFMCAGKPIALMELNKIFFEVREFSGVLPVAQFFRLPPFLALATEAVVRGGGRVIFFGRVLTWALDS